MIEVKGIYPGTDPDVSDTDIAIAINDCIDSIIAGDFEDIEVKD